MATPNGIDGLAYFGGVVVEPTESNAFNVCYYDTVNTNISLWKNSNPLVNDVPLFATQISMTILLIRSFSFIFNFFHQPHFLAEIMAACVVGPVFGRFTLVTRYIFTIKSNVVLETIANLGLVNYMFLMGLEIDLNRVKNVGKEAFCSAAAGIVLSMAMGTGLHFLFFHDRTIFPYANPLGGLFWGTALTVTSFPDLAQVLSDLSLVSTDLGQMALTSALVNDLASWIILAMSTIVLNGRSPFFIIPVAGLFLVGWFVIRPILQDLSQASLDTGKETDFQVYVIVTGYLVCGLITDAFGAHSITGAFIFGLIIPHKELRARIVGQLNSFVRGLMMPAFILVAGSRIDLSFMMSKTNVLMVLVIVVLACSAKIVSSFLVCKFFGISARESTTFGVLMNTKGILALVVIGIGRDVQALDNISYPAIVIAFVVMTAVVRPFSHWVSSSSKNLGEYKYRTIETSKDDTEFQVIMCTYESYHLSGMITLLKFSNSIKQSPMSIFALHLVELTAGSSVMLIVHDSFDSSSQNQPIFDRVMSEELKDQILKSHEWKFHPISIQPATVVAPYVIMHREVCSIAEQRHVTFILVPYHQEVGSNEGMHENTYIRTVNRNLLVKAPCSVGIFVDRGLQSSILHGKPDHGQKQTQVTILYTGGPDDREALAYAWRMAHSRDISLTVLRFLPGEEAKKLMENDSELDEKYVNEFRFKAMCDNSVSYLEKTANNGNDVIRTTKEMFDDCDLYIVGRGQGVISAFTVGLSEWSDCKDLGVLGEALSTSEFARNTSILVIQQYSEAGKAD